MYYVLVKIKKNYGSVSPNTIDNLMIKDNIDDALVSSACSNVGKFEHIINYKK